MTGDRKAGFGTRLGRGLLALAIVVAVCAESTGQVPVDSSVESAGVAPSGAPHPESVALTGALARLRSLAARGGWPQVPSGPTLRPGERDDRVPALRARLAVESDTRPEDSGSDAELFDESLEDAVRSFQSRHGLVVDGVVGGRTVEALNVPIEDRIDQVRVNLERWRRAPAELGSRHVRVDVADFLVEYRDGDRLAFRARAIVGRPDRPTPSFSSAIEAVVLAPYWYVPETIASEDKLPEIRLDPGYVESHGMTLFDAARGDPVDPFSIEWRDVTGAEFNERFRLRQDPGPDNALGEVKFLFPNEHDVFLHDTPTRHLLQQSVRTLSSGCVRLEHPIELARLLLEREPGWSVERIRSTIAAGRETTVLLHEPVPIHILYFTAFVDERGRLNFRDDIYGRDADILRLLRDDE